MKVLKRIIDTFNCFLLTYYVINLGKSLVEINFDGFLLPRLVLLGRAITVDGIPGIRKGNT